MLLTEFVEEILKNLNGAVKQLKGKDYEVTFNDVSIETKVLLENEQFVLLSGHTYPPEHNIYEITLEVALGDDKIYAEVYIDKPVRKDNDDE